MLSTIYIGINPTAFTIGSLHVAWYGIFVALAVLSLVIWALVAVRRGANLDYNTVLNAAIVGIISGIIFARLLHVLDRLPYFIENPIEIFGGEGLTIYGAVLGAALGIWIYSRFSKLNYGYFTDTIAPGIIFAQAIGRIGCTILGDDTGTFTSLPWGVVYTNPASPTNQLVGLAVTHPTITYELIYDLMVCGVLILLHKKLRPDGSLFLVYLSLYAAWRLGADFLRVGKGFLFLPLHEAQVISIVVLLITLPLLIWRTRWVKGDELPVSEEAA